MAQTPTRTRQAPGYLILVDLTVVAHILLEHFVDPRKCFLITFLLSC